MIKIWGKVFNKEKIVKHCVISVEPSNCSFFEMIKTVCEGLDVPTPVILKKHVTDFNQFNMTLFKPNDFVEKFNFDKLIIEYMPDN